MEFFALYYDFREAIYVYHIDGIFIINKKVYQHSLGRVVVVAETAAAAGSSLRSLGLDHIPHPQDGIVTSTQYISVIGGKGTTTIYQIGMTFQNTNRLAFGQIPYSQCLILTPTNGMVFLTTTTTTTLPHGTTVYKTGMTP